MSDLRQSVREHDDLHPMEDTIPCGFLRYTCEKQPRVTYMNQQMKEILRIPPHEDGVFDELEMYESNVYLMLPMEERRRFAQYLRRVYATDTPLAGEITVQRCDGTRARLFGWVNKAVNEQGEEFQSVCMDMTERYRRQQESETGRYLKALAEVYDKVFEFDLDAGMVTCLHCEPQSSFQRVKGMQIRTQDMLERWILTTVVPEDVERVREFFQNFLLRRLGDGDAQALQIRHRARASSGDIKSYTGVVIRIDDTRSLYCCHAAQEDARAQELQNENAGLKEGLRDLAMRFADGIAGFEVSSEGLVRPLYASENAYEFFRYTREEWQALEEEFTPLAAFVARTDIPYEEFAQMFQRGEAELPYYHVGTGTERRVRVICSPRKPLPGVARFAMLYDVGSVGANTQEHRKGDLAVRIRTFGYFDVFVGERPIAFRNRKAKELLALLVDRRGGFVTSEEAIGFLWEDEPVNSMTLSRYRKVALRLKNTLEEYGIPDIVESVDGKRRVVMERVTCDLYQYLSGEEAYAGLFKGSYLTNYSWAETTLGELSGDRDGFSL